jgi:hypothetical protein
MNRIIIMRILALTFITAFLIGCGAGGSGGGSEPSDFEKLSSLEANLQAEFDKLEAPINQVDAIATRLAEMPTKFKLKAEDYKDFIVSIFGSEGMKVPGGLDAAAATELKAFGTDFKAFKEQLMATPDNVTSLVTTLATTIVEVPALIIKIEGSAALTQANPMASAKSKADAAKRSADAKGLGDKVIASVKGLQGKVTGLPARATAAIGKFTEGLKSVGIDNLSALTSAPAKIGSDAVKDAKDAAKDVADSAK